MLCRVVALSVVAFLLSGCVTERSGLEFSAMSQKVGPPKVGQARVVVFREKAYGGIFDEGWNVKLDGEQLSDLKTGTYVYEDRPAGSHELISTVTLFPGVTRRDFTAAAGRTYFFLARPSERSQKLNTATAVGGLTGFFVASAMTAYDDNPGPLDFFPIEETSARAMLTDLRLAQPSH